MTEEYLRKGARGSDAASRAPRRASTRGSGARARMPELVGKNGARFLTRLLMMMWLFWIPMPRVF